MTSRVAVVVIYKSPIDDAAAQRVDPDLVLDYICEPLPQVDM